MPVPFRLFHAVRLFALLAAAAGSLACNSTEGQCQSLCEWESRCATDAVSVDDCSQQCIRNIQARGSACQSAFGDFASCADQNQSCQGVDNQCVSEADRYIAHCSCDGATGALGQLCHPSPQ
jgi:hypothetical protein